MRRLRLFFFENLNVEIRSNFRLVIRILGYLLGSENIYICFYMKICVLRIKLNSISMFFVL